MRVVLFASCQSATLYFDALCACGAPPVLVVTANDAPVLSELVRRCERTGIAHELHADANDPEFVTRLCSLQPDLLLVSGWPRRLREPVRRAARLGAINFHPSLLPYYRGKHPLFWAILRSEPEVGVSAHHITDAIDRGPVLMQRRVAVPEGATALSLAEAVDRVGAELVAELIRLAHTGALPRGTAQVGGSYFPPVSEEFGIIDWSTSARMLERWLRACLGTTRAYTYFRGMKVVAVRAHVARFDTAAAPGTILVADRNGIAVATGNSQEQLPFSTFEQGSFETLCVTHWQFLDRTYEARALVDLLEIVAGQRFSSNPALSNV